jgi:tetratricopeptide (TPR) repeat protein
MSDVETLSKEAEKLKDEGDFDAAIAKCREILERDDGHVLSHLMLAVLYGKVDKHLDAVSHGRRACELEPSDPFNFTALSVTYQRAWQGTQNNEFIQLAEEAMAQAHMLEAQGG